MTISSGPTDPAAVAFTLPTAWRPTGQEPPGGDVVVVDHRDLGDALGALAAAAGTDPAAVLLAAHAKVLGMLTEAHEFGVDVACGGPGGRVRVPHSVGAAATWRELVAEAGHALRSAAVSAADEPAGPAADDAPAEPAVRDRVLLVTRAAAGPGGADDRTPGGRYGLRVEERDGALALRPVADGISAANARRLAGLYRCVLEAMADGDGDGSGDARAARLPAAEHGPALDGLAVGAVVDRGGATFLDLFAAQVARTPDAVAVTADGGAMTYRELDRASHRVARHLAALGARPDTPVGVCLRRGPDLLPVLLGVWRSGAPYLPLDPGLPADRLRRMADAAGCELLVTRTELLPAVGTLDGGTCVLLDQERDAIAARSAEPFQVPVGPTHLAYVIYTSGSTGAPKGVMVQHGGLANYLLWTTEEYAARGTGGSAFFTSIGFDLGVPSLFAPLLVGQRVDLLPDPMDAADLGALLAAGAPYSFVKLTPGHLNLLSLDLEPEEVRTLAGLVIAAGDAFPTELVRRWAKLAGPDGTPVATEYGPTEITVGNSGAVVTGSTATELVHLGAAIPNTTMYVLTDRLEPVPDGVPGEVYVGGAGVARGYLGAPALTAERFVPDPYGAPGSRLYRTGDRARRRSGTLEFLGRTDNQVKIRGYRVELGEIRATLRRCPGVREAVIVTRDGAAGPPGLVAFVVPEPGHDLEAARLRAAVAAELPDYMIPSEIRITADVPLTANGKVDTRALQNSS